MLWSRLGAGYDPQDLRDAVDDLSLIDLHGLLRPAADLALFAAEMAQWPGVETLRELQEDQRLEQQQERADAARPPGAAR